MTEGVRLAALKRVASVITIAGAVISLGCMFVVGRHQKSLVLMALFTVWVLAPFVALIYAHELSQNWTVNRSTALYTFMLLLTLFSVAIYATVAFGPPRPQQARFFLMVPSASWLLIGIAFSISAYLGRKRD